MILTLTGAGEVCHDCRDERSNPSRRLTAAQKDDEHPSQSHIINFGSARLTADTFFPSLSESSTDDRASPPAARG